MEKEDGEKICLSKDGTLAFSGCQQLYAITPNYLTFFFLIYHITIYNSEALNCCSLLLIIHKWSTCADNQQGADAFKDWSWNWLLSALAKFRTCFPKNSPACDLLTLVKAQNHVRLAIDELRRKKKSLFLCIVPARLTILLQTTSVTKYRIHIALKHALNKHQSL